MSLVARHTSPRAVAAGLLLALGLMVMPRAADAASTQFPTETTVAPGFPATPTTGVLVPGSTAATSITTPTTSAGPTQVEEPPGAATSGDPLAGRTVWMAIGGLVCVAFLILVLTIIYARHTRPGHWKGDEGWTLPAAPDDPFSPTAATSVFAHQEDEQGFWWAED